MGDRTVYNWVASGNNNIVMRMNSAGKWEVIFDPRNTTVENVNQQAESEYVPSEEELVEFLTK